MAANNNTCENVGVANPDIAGLGILLAFAIQALLTILISVVSYLEGLLALRLHKEDELLARQRPANETPIVHVYFRLNATEWKRLQETVNALLITNSDVQIVTGISLLIAALIQIKTLAFYHLHLIYDTVSFVAISTCAALVTTTDTKSFQARVRFILMAFWAILYLVYTCLFGKRLQSWDLTIPGRCYDTHNLALPKSRHPEMDDIYIGITCLYVFSLLSMAMLTYSDEVEDDEEDGEEGHQLILSITFLQFPLHVYSIFTLRASNEKLLISGNTEQEWGFGQITALVLLIPTVVAINAAINDYKIAVESAGHQDNGAERRVELHKPFS